MVIGDFKDEHNHRHRHSALGYRTPAEYAARCSHTHYPASPFPPNERVVDHGEVSTPTERVQGMIELMRSIRN